jgi:alpha-mannosidase
MPRLASPADHEPPHADGLYLLPEPLPGHWTAAATAAGAELLTTPNDTEHPADNDLAALGLGVLVLEALTDAMSHLLTLDEAGFWEEITTIVAPEASAEARAAAAQRAAQKLKEARETIYPSQLTLLDLTTLEDLPPADWQPGPLPVNLLLTGELLERWARERPDQFDLLHRAVVNNHVEVLAAPYEKRDDWLEPLSLQEDNWRRGVTVYRRLLGHDPFVAGQVGFSFGPHTPQLLLALGVRYALLTPLAYGTLPSFRGALLEWPARDGQSITAMVRPWRRRDDPLSALNLPYYLQETIMQDFAAVIGLGGVGTSTPLWHRLWQRLHELAPVFGHHVTLRQWFSEAYASERPPRLRADDFFSDALVRQTEGIPPAPPADLPSCFAEAAQVSADGTLRALYDWITCSSASEPETATCTTSSAERLAQRLVAKSPTAEPGFVTLNPCGFSRTALVNLPSVATPMPPPARATQLEANHAWVVVDLPPFGYAWLPQRITAGTRILMPKGTLASGYLLQNERFQVAIDETTGGIRDVRLPGMRAGRLGQQLTHRSGGQMVARQVRILSPGPAFGRILAEGDLLDTQGQLLARFRQETTVIWGQPYVHLQIHLDLVRRPTGYAWHDYLACRFAWADAAALLTRATGWLLETSMQERLEAPLGVELHSAGGRTAILTRGLASLHRVGPRMLDVILVTAGSNSQDFALTLALDSEDLVTAAADVLTPVPVVPVSQGPPRSGPSGWLLDVDSPNVWVAQLSRPEGQSHALDLHVYEVRGVATEARLRCYRPVKEAAILAADGQPRQNLPCQADGIITLGIAPWEKLLVRLTD